MALEMALSVVWLVRCANCSGPRCSGMQAFMCFSSSLSKHLVIMCVSAAGCRQGTVDFLGTEMILVVLGQTGTNAVCNDRLKMSVKSASSSAHSLRS